MLSPPRKTTKRKKKPPTYYQPSIYSFTCRGAYSVSSSLMPPSAFSRSSSSSRINPNYNHDHAQQQPQQQQQAIIHERLRQQEGTCRGLRSQLELVTDELDVMTREWALQDFEHWVTQTTGSGSEDILGSLEEDAAAAAASADQNPTTAAANKSVLVPPMLVHKAPAPILHPAPPPEDNNNKEEDGNQNQNRLPTEPVVEIQPNSLHEEDHNHLIQQEDWSCYGSTQVDYLLLKDTQTGEETIAAVAPNNTTGLSVRSLQVGPDMRSSLIQLGWLTLVMQSTTEDYYDENAAAQQHDQQRDGNTISQHNTNDNPSNMIPGQEVPGPPTTDAIQAAKESAQHVAAFSKKVAQHMKANATWLYGTLQDDFASRTAASGKRILHQVPKTAEQTASVLSTLAGRLADQWLGSGSGHDDEDDEDDDDRFNGRGGGGGRRQ